MPEVNTFDPRRFLTQVDGGDITGPSDGATTVEKAADRVTHKVGLYGDVLRSVSPSSVHTVVIKLQASSPSNAVLQGYADADEESGDGIFKLRIVDVNDTAAEFTAEQAWVSKVPKLERGMEATELDWTVTAVGKLKHKGRPAREA